MSLRTLFRRPRINASADGGSPPSRSRRIDALHIFVLTGFAIAQPAYDRLGERSAFLVDMHIRPPAVLLIVFLLSVALPTSIVLVASAAGSRRPRLYEGLHAAVVFVLLTLLALPVCKSLDAYSGGIQIDLAVAAGAVGAWSYFVSQRMRSIVTFASPGCLVFPCSLLFASSMTGFVFPPDPIASRRWKPVPVVVVVLDEFCGTSLMTPDRSIDGERFPQFARLAGESTWFRNATTVHWETVQAVPAILSGRYPTVGWSPLPADRPQNLFSVLGAGGGYELAAFEPVSQLGPDNRLKREGPPPGLVRQVALLADVLGRVYLFHIAPKSFNARLPTLPGEWFGLRKARFPDESQSRRGVFRYSWHLERHRQFEHFVSCFDPEPDNVLYFMHLMIPHLTWNYLPSSRRYLDDDDGIDMLNFHSHKNLVIEWENDDLPVLQGQQRYLLQVQYVDRLIGELIDRLKAVGLFDRCLLVVTADHGVSFRRNQPRRMVTDENCADILSIPLFVKRPFQTQGAISDRNVESIDILPSIADVLGFKLDLPLDGSSVFDETQPERDFKTSFRNARPVRIGPQTVLDSDIPQSIRRRFGDPRDPAALFRIGPHPELVGREIASLPQAAESTVELEMIRYGDVLDSSPDALVPCFYEGYVRAADTPNDPVDLAVAVNGIIRAVTRTYEMNGIRDRWAALVPESSFHLGKNDVRIFSVTSVESELRLAPCTLLMR